MEEMKENAITVSPNGLRCDMTLDVLPYSDFDGTGNFSPWGVARVFEAMRACALGQTHFMNWGKLHDIFVCYIVVCDYKISPQFYHRTKGVNFRTPVHLSLEIKGITRRSLLCHSQMTFAKSGIAVAELTFRYVVIDRKTKKASGFPQWFMDKYKDLTSPDPGLVNSMNFYPPHVTTAPVHVNEVHVAFSHTDRNKHTNNSKYIVFCVDCAASAADAGKLQEYSKLTIQEMRIFYSRESVLGDKLSVSLWQLDGDKHLLYFQITKSDVNKPIFYATFAYKLSIQSKM